MRVLFVDFDGVLNSDRYFAETPWPEGSSWWSAEAIDPKAVARLNHLLTHSGAELVVSSSWRKRSTREALEEALRTRGFAHSIRGLTPCLYRTPEGQRCTRGDELRAWLQAAASEGLDIEAYAVLEDEEELGEFEAQCIRVDSRVGLTDGDVERVLCGFENFVRASGSGPSTVTSSQQDPLD